MQAPFDSHQEDVLLLGQKDDSCPRSFSLLPPPHLPPLLSFFLNMY